MCGGSSRRVGSVGSVGFWVATWLCGGLGSAPPLAAQARAPWGVRVAASAATMVSSDQLGYLAYDQIGLLADVQAGYSVVPWLDVQAGAALGWFVSTGSGGGLAAPVVGALARIPVSWTVTPYVSLDVGAGFTGELVRPFGRLGLGLDIPLGAELGFGPVLCAGTVLQPDEPANSTDASYISLGVAFSYAPRAGRTPARQAARAPAPEAPPPAAAPPPESLVVREPSVELLHLIDHAVPARTDQIELLAPVLFVYDSNELEASGVAMLHEVARELRMRARDELVEIRAYADARGSAEYNQQLAQRRATRVRDWLIEHGIDAARLRIDAAGASEFVALGSSEAEHQQNRRVVFRIQRAEAP